MVKAPRSEALAGTTWLVTGASSGIGRATATDLAGRGARVLLSGRDAEALAETAALCARPGVSDPTILAADLSDAEATSELSDRALAAAGGAIDGLVNAAGFSTCGPAIDETEADLVAQLRVLVDSPRRLIRRLAPEMVGRRNGWILNVASVAGFQAVPTQATYAASKGWLIHFSCALSVELAPQGVSVTALCPGLTRTRFFDRAGIDLDRRFARFGSFSEAEPVARCGVDAVLGRRMVAVPGLMNRAVVALQGVMPRTITGRVTSWLMSE